MTQYYPRASRLLLKALAVLVLAGLLRPAAAQAQTYQLPATGSATYTTCTGTLYDDGGATGPYSANANGLVTILPGTAGSHVRLQFNTIAVESGYDYLYVYDGPSTTSQLIGIYNSSNQPGTLYGTTASGALTVRLFSDNVIELDGFAATIGCVATVPPQPQPDLTVQGASLSPTSVVAGGALNTNCTVYNLSGSTASSSNVGYYLSSNAVLDASDVLVGSSTGFALGVGQYSSRYATVTVPLGTAAGTYYLLYAADYQNQVAESNETNNVAAVNFNVLASSVDLTTVQASVNPTSPAPGSSLYLSCYIINQGNATAASSSVGFYLSTDATLDAADQLLTSQNGPQLTPGFPALRTGTGILPGNLPLGTYYVLFVADYQNQVPESNENNNVTAVSFTVSPPGIDLVIQQPQVYPPSTVAGNSVQASCVIANQGNLTASSSTVGFYLSTNAVFDASDVLLTTVPGGSLSGGGTGSGRYAYPTIPAGTAAGSYYVLFVADPTNAVAETNETNNVASQLLTVQAATYDLFSTNTYLSPASVAPGGNTQASCYLNNQGNALASPATIGYYLSTNTVLDASDVLLGNSTGTVYGQSSSSRFAMLTVPANTATGSYYVLFVADYLNQLAETNENNNVSYATLQVVPPGIDLTISQAYLSANTSAAGNSVNTNCSIQNLGNTTAPSSTIGYYLSTNPVLDASDVLLNTAPGSSLGALQYSTRYGVITIPTGTVAGSYYVLFVADPANAVAETNETNNVQSVPLLLLAPGVDLQIQQPQLSATSVTPGFSVMGGCAVANSGTSTASSSTVGFYLSPDPVFDASDVLLSTVPGPALYAGQFNYRNATLVIPTGTAAGSYYVLFVADPANVVAETNETNNVQSLALTVNGPFTGTVVPITGTATVTTCSAVIYDNGGFSNYADNSNGSLTILSGTAGSMVQLSFTSFATETGYDYVRIYDGSSTTAPLLGTFTGSIGPSLPLTATNAAGALTVQFVSDGSVTLAGFEATASCVAAPQPDLLLTQIGASPSTVPAGNNVGLSATISNQGAGSAASSAVGYYLSADRLLSADDVLLGTSAGGSLGVNLDENRQLTTVVPITTTPGAYFMLFVADPQNVVSELNEGNNVVALPFTVTQATASRDQTAGYAVAVWPNPVAAGNPLRVQLSGVGSTGPAVIALYNALGQRVRTQSLMLSTGRPSQADVPTQGLATGVYTLRLTGAGLSVTRRVVVE